MVKTENKTCALCGRDNICNEHHLIPRKNHKKKWFLKNFTKEQMGITITVCKSDCHKYIHKVLSNKELGKHCNSIKLLLDHYKIKKYISWVKNQDKKSKI